MFWALTGQRSAQPAERRAYLLDQGCRLFEGGEVPACGQLAVVDDVVVTSPGSATPDSCAPTSGPVTSFSRSSWSAPSPSGPDPATMRPGGERSRSSSPASAPTGSAEGHPTARPSTACKDGKRRNDGDMHRDRPLAQVGHDHGVVLGQQQRQLPSFCCYVR
jgi:hypothetical protein